MHERPQADLRRGGIHFDGSRKAQFEDHARRGAILIAVPSCRFVFNSGDVLRKGATYIKNAAPSTARRYQVQSRVLSINPKASSPPVKGALSIQVNASIPLMDYDLHKSAKLMNRTYSSFVLPPLKNLQNLIQSTLKVRMYGGCEPK